MVLGEESGSAIESNCTSQHRAELNDRADLCGKLAAATAAAAAVVDIEKAWPSGGTWLQTAFKLPPSVSGYKEHKAGYDYLQESDASCPPTLEPKVYPA